MASFAERMIGAAKLDIHTYEEVEADPAATTQALIVVILYTLSAGVGVSLAGGPATGILPLARDVVLTLFGWVLWAAMIFVIGTKLLPEPETKSNIGELMRTIGFATTPGILLIGLAAPPPIGGLLALVVLIWLLVAFVIAVRQALDYKSTWRAIGVVLIGAVANGILVALLGGAS
ncbi:MAG: YIP1 family protein [Acidobacteria bacterium]|nr:YIP1 family protein [Acidobacteriota bacterium]